MPDRGYNTQGRILMRTLTSSIRATFGNQLHILSHMVAGEPVNVFGGSHGLYAAAELHSRHGIMSFGISHRCF